MRRRKKSVAEHFKDCDLFVRKVASKAASRIISRPTGKYALPDGFEYCIYRGVVGIVGRMDPMKTYVPAPGSEGIPAELFVEMEADELMAWIDRVVEAIRKGV